MKDYYYILGIKKEASLDEVKKAYRKLSMKFHPDKNDGDEFFAERFKEIQEAYETLSDSQKRKVYDGKTTTTTNQNNNPKNGFNFNPEVEYFRANKNSFEFEEEITFSWKTINSDRVTIKPFGIVQPIGQKTYRIKDFKNAVLNFELVAENTNINRQIKYSLKLNNRTYQELYSHFKKLIETEQKTNYRTKSENYKQETNYKQPSQLIKYETDKGVLELEPFINMTGTKAYLNKQPAPDGRYKLGFMDYIEIKNGIITKS